MKHWKKNLVVTWLSQFFSLTGFFFAMPFAPFYLQELGVVDDAELKIWVSLFSAASPLTLMIFSPIWGRVADRYGRRPMMLRATLGASLVLTLMATAASAQTLIFYRLLQGALTGTIVAAQTMISVSTPNHRKGMALGSLSAAVFGGMMAGQFAGGMFADAFGYRNAFFAAAAFLVVSALLILFGIRETFVRHAAKAESGASAGQARGPKRVRTNVVLFLFLVVLVSITVHFDHPWLPLLVQEIHGSLAGAAVRTGALGAVGCVSGMLSGLILGRLADRMRASIVLIFAALGAALFVIPHGLAHSFGPLFAARFAMFFFVGGIDPLFQTWLAGITSDRRRGFVFGWASTARAFGLLIAPLASGVIASGFGVRSVFFVESLMFLCLIPCIFIIGRRVGDPVSGDS